MRYDYFCFWADPSPLQFFTEQLAIFFVPPPSTPFKLQVPFGNNRNRHLRCADFGSEHPRLPKGEKRSPISPQKFRWAKT